MASTVPVTRLPPPPHAIVNAPQASQPPSQDFGPTFDEPSELSYTSRLSSSPSAELWKQRSDADSWSPDYRPSPPSTLGRRGSGGGGGAGSSWSDTGSMLAPVPEHAAMSSRTLSPLSAERHTPPPLQRTLRQSNSHRSMRQRASPVPYLAQSHQPAVPAPELSIPRSDNLLLHQNQGVKSSAHAKREAYFTSALELPLDMLSEVVDPPLQLAPSHSDSPSMPRRMSSMLGLGRTRSSSSLRSTSSATTTGSPAPPLPSPTPGRIRVQPRSVSVQAQRPPSMASPAQRNVRSNTLPHNSRHSMPVPPRAMTRTQSVEELASAHRRSMVRHVPSAISQSSSDSNLAVLAEPKGAPPPAPSAGRFATAPLPATPPTRPPAQARPAGARPLSKSRGTRPSTAPEVVGAGRRLGVPAQEARPATAAVSGPIIPPRAEAYVHDDDDGDQEPEEVLTSVETPEAPFVPLTRRSSSLVKESGAQVEASITTTSGSVDRPLARRTSSLNNEAVGLVESPAEAVVKTLTRRTSSLNKEPIATVDSPVDTTLSLQPLARRASSLSRESIAHVDSPSDTSSLSAIAPLARRTSSLGKESVVSVSPTSPLELSTTPVEMSPPPMRLPPPPCHTESQEASTVRVDCAKSVPPHRLQRPLLRPALATPDVNGNNPSGRSQRDGTSSGLQVGFVPASYPLPPSSHASSAPAPVERGPEPLPPVRQGSNAKGKDKSLDRQPSKIKHSAHSGGEKVVVATSSDASVTSVQNNDDHVSFEVNSVKRGRLHVSLNWLPSRRNSQRSQAAPIPPPKDAYTPSLAPTPDRQDMREYLTAPATPLRTMHESPSSSYDSDDIRDDPRRHSLPSPPPTSSPLWYAPSPPPMGYPAMPPQVPPQQLPPGFAYPVPSQYPPGMHPRALGPWAQEPGHASPPAAGTTRPTDHHRTSSLDRSSHPPHLPSPSRTRSRPSQTSWWNRMLTFDRGGSDPDPIVKWRHEVHPGRVPSGQASIVPSAAPVQHRSRFFGHEKRAAAKEAAKEAREKQAYEREKAARRAARSARRDQRELQQAGARRGQGNGSALKSVDPFAAKPLGAEHGEDDGMPVKGNGGAGGKALAA